MCESLFLTENLFVKQKTLVGWIQLNIRMQSGHGQYGGVPGIQQFVVEGCSSPHGLFAALSQEQINHNTNHPLQAHQAIQQAGFQNQKVLQQHHQLGLQGPESSDAPLRSRDKAYASSLREAPALGHVQARDQGPAQTLTDDDGGGDEGERGGGGVNRWPREETLALLRIRSGLDSNFRDSNIKGPLWENVSRKLGEIGYYRSAKKCKEKFENISKYYKKTKDGRIGRQDGKSYRFFSELEALYSHSHGVSRSANRTTHGQEVAGIGGPEKTSNAASLNLSSDNTSEDDHCNNTQLQNPRPPKTLEQVNRKKRKRKHLASITAFFESLVKQVMGHQEELHRKFLEAIERREQERLNREEAWKRQEMARLNRETELRAQEQALASSREAAIVAFLQKITGQNLNLPTSVPPPSVPTETQQDQEKLPTDAAMPMADPNCKRWPKPEVQALIRLRSDMDVRFRETGFKGPLWEEISSGMSNLGFQRSAKRCKEKWENINKYFRKTKDNIKKRPQNAKTCPYFHQLNLLYSDNPKSNKTDQCHSSDDQADPDRDNDNDNNNVDDDEHTETARPSDHSELLAAMIHGDQAGQTSLAKTNAATTTVHDHFFQNDHHVDQVQKRFKTRQHLPTGIQASNPLAIISESGPKPNAFEDTFSGNIKKGNTMDSLVKEMLEMQQQKFLDAFERREHEQDQQQSMSSEERHRHHHPEETTQDDRSQSALMALVHKLTGNAADYATG